MPRLLLQPEHLLACNHPVYHRRLVDEQGKLTAAGHKGKAYVRMVQIPCARQRCPCVKCRQSWARKESAILAKSFSTLPPSHFVVLRHSTDSPAELSACLSRFVQQIRDLRKQGTTFEYAAYVEATKNEPPHVHLLVRTTSTMTKAKVRDMWQKACQSETVSVYMEPCRDAGRAAKYVPKFWAMREGQRCKLYVPWLPGDDWAGHRLHMTSAGFLSHSRQELWQMVKHEWFGNDSDDLSSYPLWTPPADAPETAGRPLSRDDFDAILATISRDMATSDELSLYTTTKSGSPDATTGLETSPADATTALGTAAGPAPETAPAGDDELSLSTTTKSGDSTPPGRRSESPGLPPSVSDPVSPSLSVSRLDFCILPRDVAAKPPSKPADDVRTMSRVRRALTGRTTPETAVDAAYIAALIHRPLDSTVRAMLAMPDVVRLDGWRDSRGYAWYNLYHLSPMVHTR